MGGTRDFVIGWPWLRRPLGHPILVPAHHEGMIPAPLRVLGLGLGLDIIAGLEAGLGVIVVVCRIVVGCAAADGAHFFVFAAFQGLSTLEWFIHGFR